MSFTARIASFVASGTSIAFLIITAVILLGAEHLEAKFLIWGLRNFPFIGIVFIACQMFPHMCPSYLRATASHDKYTSWFSFVGIILVVLYAEMMLPYFEQRPYLVRYAIGFAALDALMLGVAAAVRTLLPRGAAAPH